MDRRKADRVRLNNDLGDIGTDRDPQGQTPFIHLVGQPAEFGDQNFDSAIFRTLNKVVNKMVPVDDGPEILLGFAQPS
jgi:hypothetical protein